MTQTPLSPKSTVPDSLGRFGQFGGKYVPETLMPALAELESALAQYRNDPEFQAELAGLLKDYVGRPSPSIFRRASNRTLRSSRWHWPSNLSQAGRPEPYRRSQDQ